MTVTYALDVANQYTAVGGTSRPHDTNGNLADGGTHKFVCDFKNPRVEVENNSTKRHDLDGQADRCDALGRRSEKAVSGGATTRYVIDDRQVVEEHDGSDVRRVHVYEGRDRPAAIEDHPLGRHRPGPRRTPQRPV